MSSLIMISLLSLHQLLPRILCKLDQKGFKSALKVPHWLTAMREEMDFLDTNNTWDLVPRPPGENIVGSKWVFHTKYKSDDSIDRYKARLVAPGFTQVPGFDFSHTFSSVVRAATVRVIFTLAVQRRWPIHQLDVKKALYGLRQTPRACSDCTIFLLLYVDDIIVTGSSADLLRRFIARVHKEFAVKDLGKLSYFLGLEITHTDSGLFLGQTKYAHDILTRAELLDSKPVSTPLAIRESLVSTGDPFQDPTLYRSLVGTLQYLTITRPDLSFAVNHVSQFLQALTVDHFSAVKRILRYVKGTVHLGLTFSSSSDYSILGYSDADWARCEETHQSTLINIK